MIFLWVFPWFSYFHIGFPMVFHLKPTTIHRVNHDFPSLFLWNLLFSLWNLLWNFPFSHVFRYFWTLQAPGPNPTCPTRRRGTAAGTALLQGRRLLLRAEVAHGLRQGLREKPCGRWESWEDEI